MTTYKQRRGMRKAAKTVLYRRTKPYTEIGIKRLECFRHGYTNKASRQWQICSDGNTFRPICDSCDVELNRIVLEFMGFKNHETMMKEYRKEINSQEP